MKKRPSPIYRQKYRPDQDSALLGPDAYVLMLQKTQKTPMIAKPTAEATQTDIPEGCWQCFHCRQINKGKFCTECGSPRV